MDLHEIFKEIGAQQQPMQLTQGVVSATAAGSVSVRIAGATTPVTGIKYLSSYSPTTNDVVFMLVNGNDVLILGKRG